MSTTKKPIPPVDIIHEDSGPPLTGVKEQQESNKVDIDDAQIQEPKDGAFKKQRRPAASIWKDTFKLRAMARSRKNPHAVALSPWGEKKSGPARAAKLKPLQSGPRAPAMPDSPAGKPA